MSTTTKPGATAEDVRKAFADLLSSLDPESRAKIRRDNRLTKLMDDGRRASIHRWVESPEALERRRQVVNSVTN